MQACPSLSAALMMLCRITAVSLWQVCKCSRLHSARIRVMPKTRRKERRRSAQRGTEMNIYTRRSSPSAQKAGHNIQLRVSPQHLATSISRILMWVVHQNPAGQILWQFNAVFTRNAWTRTRLDSFPGMQTQQVRLEYALCAMRIAIDPTSFPLWSAEHWEGKICIDYLPWRLWRRSLRR